MAAVSAILQAGLEHQKGGRLDEAERHYRTALAIEPRNPDALHLLGLVAHQTGRNEEAIGLLEQAVALADGIALFHSHLGLAQIALGRIREGCDSQWQALARDPNLLQAHLILVQTLLPGEHYHQVLQRLHARLRPAVYLEIGIETGVALAFARPPTVAIGVDPAPRLSHGFTADTRIFEITSDAFFADVDLAGETGRRPLDLAFIDGMHTFDQTLRDFINVERLAHPKTVVLIHDCLPLSAATATRERHTTFWSGDTWRIVPLLKRHRPDLTIRTVAAPPTGLAIVTGLDSASTVLADRFDAIVGEYMSLDFDYLAGDRDAKLNVIPNDWAAIDRHLASALAV